ncbi:hypothetical protein JHW43_002943 [Diplocarpon mali]|nr:hypothetical protein JHW43_002943 [Diplocarpon mali]
MHDCGGSSRVSLLLPLSQHHSPDQRSAQHTHVLLQGKQGLENTRSCLDNDQPPTFRNPRNLPRPQRMLLSSTYSPRPSEAQHIPLLMNEGYARSGSTCIPQRRRYRPLIFRPEDLDQGASQICSTSAHAEIPIVNQEGLAPQSNSSICGPPGLVRKTGVTMEGMEDGLHRCHNRIEKLKATIREQNSMMLRYRKRHTSLKRELNKYRPPGAKAEEQKRHLGAWKAFEIEYDAKHLSDIKTAQPPLSTPENGIEDPSLTAPRDEVLEFGGTTKVSCWPVEV